MHELKKVQSFCYIFQKLTNNKFFIWSMHAKQQTQKTVSLHTQR